jgi:MarR family transcriptional repressor of emrRAB
MNYPAIKMPAKPAAARPAASKSAALVAIEAGVRRVATRIPGVPEQDVVLLRLLKHLNGAFSVNLGALLKSHALGESDFQTLMVLFSDPDGRAHPSQLCHFARQSPTNMTRICDGLVERGLLTRMASLEDRRRIDLQISKRGERLVEQLLPSIYPQIELAFSALSKTEKRVLHGLLSRLATQVEGMTREQEEGA